MSAEQEPGAVVQRPVLAFRSIKTKVTLTVTSAFVVLLILVSGIEMYRVKASLGRVLGDQQLTLVSRVADEIDDKLKAAHGALIAVSGALPAIARDRDRLHNDLERRPGLRSLFDGMFVFALDGTVIVELPAIGALGHNAADREYFLDTLKNRRGVISQPYVGRVLKEPVIMLTAPVLDQKGEPVAILAGTLNLLKPNFLGKLGTANVGKTGQFALFGRDRTIIISRDRERIMTAGPAPGKSPYFDRAVAGGEGWEESVNSRGLHALFSYSPLETVPWVLVAALPVDEAYAPIAQAWRHIAAFTIALLVILAPIVWLGTARLIAPLIALHDGIRRIRGHPDKVAEVPVQGNDEIGDLAADFNALMRERNDAATALHDSAHRLSLIADNVPALISYVDSSERYRYVNASYGEWFGTPSGEVLGRTVREVVGEANYALRLPYVRQALAGTEAGFTSPLTVCGVERHVQVRYVPDRRDDGTVAGFYILAIDITELKRTEEMLRDSQRQLILALEGSQLALFDWNIAKGEVFLSEQWAALMGGRPQPTRVAFKELERQVHPDDRDIVGRSIRDVLKGASSHYRVEHRVRTDDGRWLWIQSHGQVTERDESGRALRLLGTNADISRRKRNEQELAASRMDLERAALIDSLTGLPNRRELDARVRQALSRAQRAGHIVAVLCLDIDIFKSINDTMGHAAGDAVLKEFSVRLSRCIRASDTAARLGGDEFVVLLEDLHRPEDAHGVAGKIIAAMRDTFTIDSDSVRITTSIGIAFTHGNDGAEDLLKRADAALYEAKRAGRDRFHVAGALQANMAPAANPADGAGRPVNA